ncbi:hypothetical protein C8F01DRAFT_1301388 [Mycena amicta]|nr:hypothetical protein C8F01DRAFT_1301388 [Mycena amicta]
MPPIRSARKQGSESPMWVPVLSDSESRSSSESVEEEVQGPVKDGGKTFMPTLYKLLSSKDATVTRAISWSADGTSIVIKDNDLWEDTIPTYFPNQTKPMSWRRAMNSYGFKRTTSASTNIVTWTHATLRRTSTRSYFISPIHGSSKTKKPKSRGLDSANDRVAPECKVESTEPQAWSGYDMPSLNLPTSSSVNDELDETPTPSVENFLVKIYRMAKDPANAAVIGWDRGGRLAIWDPDQLPNLLLQEFGVVQGFYPGLLLHGFELTPMRYGRRSNAVFAWKHPVLDKHYPAQQLGQLTEAAAAQLAQEATRSPDQVATAVHDGDETSDSETDS